FVSSFTEVVSASDVGAAALACCSPSAEFASSIIAVSLVERESSGTAGAWTSSASTTSRLAVISPDESSAHEINPSSPHKSTQGRATDVASQLQCSRDIRQA